MGIQQMEVNINLLKIFIIFEGRSKGVFETDLVIIE